VNFLPFAASRRSVLTHILPLPRPNSRVPIFSEEVTYSPCRVPLVFEFFRSSFYGSNKNNSSLFNSPSSEDEEATLLKSSPRLGKLPSFSSPSRRPPPSPYALSPAQKYKCSPASSRKERQPLLGPFGRFTFRVIPVVGKSIRPSYLVILPSAGILPSRTTLLPSVFRFCYFSLCGVAPASSDALPGQLGPSGSTSSLVKDAFLFPTQIILDYGVARFHSSGTGRASRLPPLGRGADWPRPARFFFTFLQLLRGRLGMMQVVSREAFQMRPLAQHLPPDEVVPPTSYGRRSGCTRFR